MLSNDKIPIIITNKEVCDGYLIQEKTRVGSLNVLITSLIDHPIISQEAYYRLKSKNKDTVTVSHSKGVQIESRLYNWSLTSSSDTVLKVFRGSAFNSKKMDGNYLFFECNIATGLPHYLDLLLPRSSLPNMQLLFMRRFINNEWVTLWAHASFGEHERNKYIFHVEEFDPRREPSSMWIQTREDKSFNKFSPLVGCLSVNYPVGFGPPKENNKWYTTPLKSMKRDGLYTNLRQTIRAYPSWDLHVLPINQRVAPPRDCDFNTLATYGLVNYTKDGAANLDRPKQQHSVTPHTELSTTSDSLVSPGKAPVSDVSSPRSYKTLSIVDFLQQERTQVRCHPEWPLEITVPMLDIMNRYLDKPDNLQYLQIHDAVNSESRDLILSTLIRDTGRLKTTDLTQRKHRHQQKSLMPLKAYHHHHKSVVIHARSSSEQSIDIFLRTMWMKIWEHPEWPLEVTIPLLNIIKGYFERLHSTRNPNNEDVDVTNSENARIGDSSYN